MALKSTSRYNILYCWDTIYCTVLIQYIVLSGYNILYCPDTILSTVRIQYIILSGYNILYCPETIYLYGWKWIIGFLIFNYSFFLHHTNSHLMLIIFIPVSIPISHIHSVWGGFLPAFLNPAIMSSFPPLLWEVKGRSKGQLDQGLLLSPPSLIHMTIKWPSNSWEYKLGQFQTWA